MKSDQIWKDFLNEITTFPLQITAFTHIKGYEVLIVLLNSHHGSLLFMTLSNYLSQIQWMQ